MTNEQLIEELMTLAENLSERVTTLETAAAKKPPATAAKPEPKQPDPTDDKDPIELARAAIRRVGNA